MNAVTVVIPSFNRAHVLPRAIDSALQQRGVATTVVVVDDGSTDDTAEISIRCGARYLRLEHTGLPAVARNVGARSASGRYVAFLDSDDAWLPGKLERQLTLLEAEPEVVLCSTNALAERDGIARGSYLDLSVESGRVGLERLAATNLVVCSTAVVRLEALRAAGGFAESELLRGVEDYDLWLRLGVEGEIAYIAEPLAVYHDETSASLRGGQPRAQSTAGRLAALQRVGRLLPDGDRRAPQVWSAALACTNELAGLQSPSPRGLRQKVGRRLGRRGGARTRSVGLRLHLGCGERYLPGYVNIDFPPHRHAVQRVSGADVYADLRDLSFPPGTVAEIVLRHVLEHFDRVTATRLLAEWHRWLAPGGLLVLETPDFKRSIEAFLQEPGVDRQLKILRHVFGSQEAAWALHRDGWYPEKFEFVLDALGFDVISAEASEWHGTFNTEVCAVRRDGDHDDRASESAVARLAALSLVDDSSSERRLLEVWLAGGGRSLPSAFPPSRPESLEQP